VTIPDTPDYKGLRNFHDPKNLAFRAACTGAAPPLTHPITGRVIQRIYDSDDAKAILMRLWDTMQANGTAVSHHRLAAALTEDLCWQTLVHEEVNAIRSFYRHSIEAHW
jgi:hypothetical protein